MNFSHLLLSRLLIFVTITILSSTVLASETQLSQAKINSRVLNISSPIYAEQSKKLPSHLARITKLKKLVRTIKDLEKSEKSQLAIATIIANMSTIETNIDDGLIDDIAWYLYSNNAKNTADAILKYSENNSNDYSTSKIKFQKAKYFFAHQDWEAVITTLKNTNINAALEPQEGEYAYFMTGFALQQIRQHRDALKVYSVIKKDSVYYSTAQSNQAISNIRQDWWTDAHINIKNAIEIETELKNFNLVDRLHLTLGFSQIQNEFYRDAREAFRSVGIDSPYADRALLGIGLAAMHQKDFTAALNAFTILNDKNTQSRSVQESHLLAPYVHEKLGQNKLAEVKYTQASVYYQKRNSEIERDINRLNFDSIRSNLNVAISDKVQAPDTEISIGIQHHSYTLHDVLTQLFELRELTLSKEQEEDLRELESDTLQLAYNLRVAELKNELAINQSYLNQCQFALARLYDENQ